MKILIMSNFWIYINRKFCIKITNNVSLLNSRTANNLSNIINVKFAIMDIIYKMDNVIDILKVEFKTVKNMYLKRFVMNV